LAIKKVHEKSSSIAIEAGHLLQRTTPSLMTKTVVRMVLE